MHRNPDGFLQAYGTVLVPGAPPVLFESVHSCSPYSLRADELLAPGPVARSRPATPDGPLRILAGDFNATLDHALLRRLLATGYVDAADRAGEGLVGTWGPYDGDRIPPVVIDHVLVDRRIGVRGVSVHAAARAATTGPWWPSCRCPPRDRAAGQAGVVGPRQAVGERVDQRVPARLDHVLVHADRGPVPAGAVGGLHQHPGDRAGAVACPPGCAPCSRRARTWPAPGSAWTAPTRSASSSALTGPLPSAVAITRSPRTRTLTVASDTTAPSSRCSTSTR